MRGNKRLTEAIESIIELGEDVHPDLTEELCAGWIDNWQTNRLKLPRYELIGEVRKLNRILHAGEISTAEIRATLRM